MFSMLLCIWCRASLAYSQLFCSLGQVQQNDETTHNAEVGSFTHAHTRRQVFLFFVFCFGSWQLMFMFGRANGWVPFTSTVRLNNLLVGKGDSSKIIKFQGIFHVPSWKVDLFSYLFFEGFLPRNSQLNSRFQWCGLCGWGLFKRGRCIAPGDWLEMMNFLWEF